MQYNPKGHGLLPSLLEMSQHGDLLNMDALRCAVIGSPHTPPGTEEDTDTTQGFPGYSFMSETIPCLMSSGRGHGSQERG